MTKIQYTHAIAFLLSMISVLHLPLCAQKNECCPAEDCPPEYVYYHSEEKNCMGGNRIAVAVGSAILAGAVIGGIVIGCSCKQRHHSHKHCHHSGSDSCYSGSCYSGSCYSGSCGYSSDYSDYYSLQSEEFYNDLDHDHHHHDHSYEFYSDDFSGYSDYYSYDNHHHGHHHHSAEVVVIDRAKCKAADQNQGLLFEVHLENTNSVLTAIPFVTKPDGEIIEGESLTISNSSQFPAIRVEHPIKGTYQAGVKILTPHQTGYVSVHVKDAIHNSECDLDPSGTYEFNE
jgi:hypothetical protein